MSLGAALSHPVQRETHRARGGPAAHRAKASGMRSGPSAPASEGAAGPAGCKAATGARNRLRSIKPMLSVPASFSSGKSMRSGLTITGLYSAELRHQLRCQSPSMISSTHRPRHPKRKRPPPEGGGQGLLLSIRIARRHYALQGPKGGVRCENEGYDVNSTAEHRTVHLYE